MAKFNLVLWLFAFMIIFSASSGSATPRELRHLVTLYCVAYPGASAAQLDYAISFCCSQSGVDCSVIQPGNACYNPNNKSFHASVVLNQYFKLHGAQRPFCSEGSLSGIGFIVFKDPSQGSCKFQ